MCEQKLFYKMKPNIIKILTIAILAYFYSFDTFAQSVLTGKVKNDSEIFLENAYVSIPQLNIGSATDANGAFSISGIPAGKYNVEISYVGYESVTAVERFSNNETVTKEYVLNYFPKALNEIIVTGVTNPKSALESSISISTLKAKDVANGVARTTAEVFRTIPGVRSESSGGEGNSNITVRGVPVSAGGSRYMLLQEDGLPVLQFGDVSFGTQDQFLRYDYSVKRIEAVRGGSASVLASNSPAGIINLISNTGEVAGGSVGTTIGLDFPMLRTDFDYGSPIANDVSFHIGGFYRNGDGPRQTGYTSNNGGQLKANLTKKFDKGFVRLYMKYLNDRTAAYMPMPIGVSGTNSSPTWKSLANYDALNGALQSVYLLKDRTMGGNGNVLETDVADGMHSNSKSVGAEFNFSPSDGWEISNKVRYSMNDGQFIAPFPASAGTATETFAGISGFNKAVYAGTNNDVNSAGTFMRIHLFNTKLNNFNNFVNDFSISKSFDKVKVNVGYYKSLQNISMSWNWNTYLMEANSSNPRLVDILDSKGNLLTQNGQLAYGVPAWGNCCNRNYDTKYATDAPYVSLEVKPVDNLVVDAGLRYDIGHAYGSFSGGNGQTAAIDMNGNGVIDTIEKSVATISNNTTPVDYNYNLLSYSVGANYRLGDNQSVFIRTSKGGSASADRVLFSGYNYVGSSDPKLDAQKLNTVAQTEVGYKFRREGITVNSTFFYAITKESNYEATTQKKIDNKYRSLGVELDAIMNFGSKLNLRAGLTYTNAKITAALDNSVVNNVPRRLPAIMFNATPVYNITKDLNIGFTLLAFTKSFAQDNNKLVMPGYVVLNPFINYNVLKNFSVNLSGNNVLNALGVTESEEGSITENTNNVVRARPIPGRSISFGLKYIF